MTLSSTESVTVGYVMCFEKDKLTTETLNKFVL